MTITSFSSGVNTSFSSELNSNFSSAYTLQGLNHIRQLIDRNGVYSKGFIDGWGEAYIDANGRNDSVDTGSTTAKFDIDKYKPIFSNPNTYYVEINASSINAGTLQTYGATVIQLDTNKWVLYKSDNTATINKSIVLKSLFYKAYGSEPNGITSLTSLKPSSSDDVNKNIYSAKGTFTASAGGSTDTGYYTFTLGSSTDIDSWYYLSAYSNNTSVTSTSSYESPSGTGKDSVSAAGSGGYTHTLDRTGDLTSNQQSTNVTSLRFTVSSESSRYASFEGFWMSSSTGSGAFTTSGAGAWSSTNEGGVFSFSTQSTGIDNIVVHTIPTGTFSDTISSAIGVPLISDWETGADIQYKLTNSTEDTGWLNTMSPSPEISSFTAFTSEPTTLIVKLIPKTSSPTAGYPSIKGFWVLAS